MPSVPAFTIAEAAYQTAGPVDTFVLRPNGHPASILDTVFVSRRLRRAVYATTTIKGLQTDLWRVERSGRLTLVANIRWEYEWQTPTVTAAGDGSLKTVYGPVRKVPAVCFAARIWKVDEFLRKSRGWFPSDSRLFTAGDTEYKWKSGTENSSTNDGQHDRSSTRAYHEPWKIWRCVAVNSTAVHNSSPSYSSQDTNLQQEIPTTGPSNVSTVADPHIHQSPRHMPSIDSFTVAQDLLSPSTPNVRARLAPVLAAPAPPTILARFAPPQLGLTHHELALFPSAFFSADLDQNQFLVESLLLSAVLLAVNKGEWKNVQSLADKDALEAVFIAEARGEVPPYTTRVGQAIQPPIPQRDHIQAQSGPIPHLDAFGMNYERPRTAPARQLDLQQTQSRLDPQLRTGRQLHRTFHSIPIASFCLFSTFIKSNGISAPSFVSDT
ncbi:hypothetical protein FRC17_006604 [Serendipita sp. 399]|nr:hypothetical protein FRC17_006604 [Serendipita sp. 399]